MINDKQDPKVFLYRSELECLDDGLRLEVTNLLNNKKLLAAARLLLSRGFEVEMTRVISTLLETRYSYTFILHDWDMDKPDEDQYEIEERFFRAVESRHAEQANS